MQKWFPDRTLNLLSHVWPFCHTNSLEKGPKWPFSPLKIDLISQLLSFEKRAFYMHPMRGSCKLDLSTWGYNKTWLSSILGIWTSSLSKMSKRWPVFILLEIMSFSNDIVSPINLINALIINYHRLKYRKKCSWIHSCNIYLLLMLRSLSNFAAIGKIQKNMWYTA